MLNLGLPIDKKAVFDAIPTASTELFSANLIHQAWTKVLGKGKVGGVDGITLQDYGKELKNNLRELRKELNEGIYSPEPAVETKIPKEKQGEFRTLGMLTVKDKIAQHTVKLILEPVAEPLFYHHSYAYRPGKSHLQVIEQITNSIKNGLHFGMGLDIDNFFDSIPHDLILKQLNPLVADSKLYHYLELWLSVGSVNKSHYNESALGIAQGSVISPILANIFLNPFDHWLSKSFKKLHYFRYADNLFLMSKEKEYLEYSVQEIEKYLNDKFLLKLNLHNQIAAVPGDSEFNFCGIRFTEENKKIKRIITETKMIKSGKTIDAILSSLANSRNHDRLETAARAINDLLDGWIRYYKPFETQTQLTELETLLSDGLFRISREQNLSLGNWMKNLHWLYFNGEQYRKQFEVADNKQKENNSDVISKTEKQVENRTLISDAARKKIRKTKRKYLKKFSKQYDLNLDHPGMYIGKYQQQLLVKDSGRETGRFPVTNLKHVAISSARCSVSSDALFLMAANGISLELLNWAGKPVAMLTGHTHSSPILNMAQIEAAVSVKGKEIAKSITLCKIKNQESLIRYWSKSRLKLGHEWDETVSAELKRMETYRNSIKDTSSEMILPDFRNRLMGFEGLSAGSYWAVVKIFLQPVTEFTGRKRKGASDSVNMILNYGYGILYSRLWAMILHNQLNPYCAFLHSEQEGKPVLSFDLIEPFRQPVVDRTLLGLITKKVIRIAEATHLTDEQRHQISDAIQNRLYTPFFHNRKQTTYHDIIDRSVKQLADYLSGKSEKFSPYLMKW